MIQLFVDTFINSNYILDIISIKISLKFFKKINK